MVDNELLGRHLFFNSSDVLLFIFDHDKFEKSVGETFKVVDFCMVVDSMGLPYTKENFVMVIKLLLEERAKGTLGEYI